ncbi:hypothetical protein Pint_32518 [Pistacia integerrima]|uniref:Uncharacterized protein n=1 Tax=Pistacia integerrima TaxID=434235 RepID=A0ACC0XTG7_9ROSI|nr:hypothetical protein Pint_32518 [Pistacia integerrima]
MAPEVVRGEYQGPESDVWSLGCTIIEMVTGRPAWEDFGADTLTRIGFSKELPVFPVQLSELGRDFVEKCLRREPSERWSCDQLLQHPFLLSVNNTVTESSPRCVLDYINSEFQEDEDDSDCENFESSARERIGKLASSSGANWESDGWVAARDYEEEEVMNTEAGTSSVFDTGANSEIENIGGSEFGCGGGCPSCHSEWQKVELAVESPETGIYRMCNLLLLCFNCLRIFRYILLILYIFIFYILYPPQIQFIHVNGTNSISCVQRCSCFTRD